MSFFTRYEWKYYWNCRTFARNACMKKTPLGTTVSKQMTKREPTDKRTLRRQLTQPPTTHSTRDEEDKIHHEPHIGNLQQGQDTQAD